MSIHLISRNNTRKREHEQCNYHGRHILAPLTQKHLPDRTRYKYK